jgi:hypothetical protein
VAEGVREVAWDGTNSGRALRGVFTARLTAAGARNSAAESRIVLTR